MASKRLTECWREAMAAKPSTWKLMGIACGPRELDPKIRTEGEWCAWARGPKGERTKGRGTGLLGPAAYGPGQVAAWGLVASRTIG